MHSAQRDSSVSGAYFAVAASFNVEYSGRSVDSELLEFMIL